jgi:hypothetical protein
MDLAVFLLDALRILKFNNINEKQIDRKTAKSWNETSY